MQIRAKYFLLDSFSEFVQDVVEKVHFYYFEIYVLFISVYFSLITVSEEAKLNANLFQAFIN